MKHFQRVLKAADYSCSDTCRVRGRKRPYGGLFLAIRLVNLDISSKSGLSTACIQPSWCPINVPAHHRVLHQANLSGDRRIQTGCLHTMTTVKQALACSDVLIMCVSGDVCMLITYVSFDVLQSLSTISAHPQHVPLLSPSLLT